MPTKGNPILQARVDQSVIDALDLIVEAKGYASRSELLAEYVVMGLMHDYQETITAPEINDALLALGQGGVAA